MEKQMIRVGEALTKLVRPQVDHRLLFLYDELMAEEHLAVLVPEPRFVQIAWLTGHQLVFNDEGTATIVKRWDRIVWGAVWEVHQVAQVGLDIALGRSATGICDRVGCLVQGDGDTQVLAEYYASRNSSTRGRADPELLAVILAEAKRRGFPEYYQSEIEGWVKPERSAVRRCSARSS